ncbi:MAG: 50S ribosomal protein L11 methyltransferase [Pseudomonadota bacterium]
MTQVRLFICARKPEANHIASILDAAFDEDTVPTALFEEEGKPGSWCYSLYVEEDEADAWRGRIHEILGSDCFGLPLQTERLGDVDWVSETLKDLKPVSAGQYFVHGSHDRAAARHKRFPVEIDAGQAFGTGHHGTTAGCLDMLEETLKSNDPDIAFDVGTGSGVLAISLAKSCTAAIVATDIDPVSVEVAAENARINGVASAIHFETATGFHHRVFRDYCAADVILANILAGPLAALAPALARHTAPGGTVILSGLLPHQETRIRATYRNQGLVFHRRHIRDGWLTLVLKG